MPSSTELLPPLAEHFMLLPGFLSGEEAERVFQALLRETPWEERQVHLFGRDIPMPRRVCWYGPVAYAYSGTEHPARPMPPAVDGLRQRVEVATGVRFNAVLLNLYRDGNDSMGLHSDDDYNHGGQPCVASLSLGAARRLRLVVRGPGGQRLGVDLEPGSLLLMRERAQQLWRHGVSRTAREVGPRINLTFRHHLGPRLP
jgi:alkylated DNA repair dioxygenase AlkB